LLAKERGRGLHRGGGAKAVLKAIRKNEKKHRDWARGSGLTRGRKKGAGGGREVRGQAAHFAHSNRSRADAVGGFDHEKEDTLGCKGEGKGKQQTPSRKKRKKVPEEKGQMPIKNEGGENQVE